MSRRRFAVAGLVRVLPAFVLLAPAARADDANRYEIVIVPTAGVASEGKTETILLDRQTGRTWMRTTEFDPTTFQPKEIYWLPQHFKALPPDDSKPLLPPS